MTRAESWAPGDRVLVTPTGREEDYTGAVVEHVDATGVHLCLDRHIRGITTACATPRELLAESYRRRGSA